MSKNNHTNHSNHLENHDSDNFSKTGYSNSRLSAHTVCISKPKISFDRMTIVHLKIEIMLLSIDKSIIMVYMDI